MDDLNQTDKPAAPSETPATAETPSGEGAATGQPIDSKPPTSDQVKMALRKVKDPELNLNIIDLGLVYEIAVDGSEVQIDMTLTSPGCPAGPEIMGDVERTVKAMPGVSNLTLNLVWQPFWSPDRIEPRVRNYMGL